MQEVEGVEEGVGWGRGGVDQTVEPETVLERDEHGAELVGFDAQIDSVRAQSRCSEFTDEITHRPKVLSEDGTELRCAGRVQHELDLEERVEVQGVVATDVVTEGVDEGGRVRVAVEEGMVVGMAHGQVVLEHRDGEFFLRREVRVKGASCEPSSEGDLLDAGSCYAVLGEDVGCGGDDPVAGLVAGRPNARA
jgi:hypothetical protein